MGFPLPSFGIKPGSPVSLQTGREQCLLRQVDANSKAHGHPGASPCQAVACDPHIKVPGLLDAKGLPTPHPQSATGLDSEKFRSSQGCQSKHRVNIQGMNLLQYACPEAGVLWGSPFLRPAQSLASYPIPTHPSCRHRHRPPAAKQASQQVPDPPFHLLFGRSPHCPSVSSCLHSVSSLKFLWCARQTALMSVPLARS